MVQLVLTLFRNILAVQEIPTHQKSGGLATQLLSMRDRFLELLFRENVMDIMLVISQCVGSSNVYLRQDNLLLLEIFHYILMGQDPELIVWAHLKESKVSPLIATDVIFCHAGKEHPTNLDYSFWNVLCLLFLTAPILCCYILFLGCIFVWSITLCKLHFRRMNNPKLLFIVSSSFWRRKRREEIFVSSTI